LLWLAQLWCVYDYHYDLTCQVFRLTSKQPTTDGTATKSFAELRRGLPVDPDGVFHLADDGVYRSYSANGTVLAYLALTPDQISTVINAYPVKDKTHLTSVYDGVDGTTVNDHDQLWKPSSDLLPNIFRTDALAKRIPCDDVPDTTPAKRDTFLRPRDDYCDRWGCRTNGACRSAGCDYCDVIDNYCSGTCADYN
jgi:hypothetical protein